MEKYFQKLNCNLNKVINIWTKNHIVQKLCADTNLSTASTAQ